MHLKNRVISSLTSTQFGAIAPCLTEMHIQTGQTLYEPGDFVEAIFFPTDAVLSVVTVMKDGRCVEAATIGNESVVGVVTALAGVAARARTFAQIGGGALRLPALRLRELVLEHPSLMKLLFVHVHGDIAQSEQSVACNALHSAKQRLARWLLLSQDRVGSSIITLTQEYLAIMLGVQRTTVTAAAQALRTEGIVLYRRGRIEVIDRAGLERAACECYTAALRLPAVSMPVIDPAAMVEEVA